LSPNIELAYVSAFLQDKNKPGPCGRVFCFLIVQYGDLARFPWRSRHSAPDNALNSPLMIEDRRKSRSLIEGYFIPL
jgi:hypothetical protein